MAVSLEVPFLSLFEVDWHRVALLMHLSHEKKAFFVTLPCLTLNHVSLPLKSGSELLNSNFVKNHLFEHIICLYDCISIVFSCTIFNEIGWLLRILLQEIEIGANLRYIDPFLRIMCQHLPHHLSVLLILNLF